MGCTTSRNEVSKKDQNDEEVDATAIHDNSTTGVTKTPTDPIYELKYSGGVLVCQKSKTNITGKHQKKKKKLWIPGLGVGAV
jgi:hypothetical protein